MPNHRRWSPVSANTGRFNLWWGVFFMSFAHVSTGVLIFYLIYMSSLCTKDNTSPRYCWQSRVSSFWWNDQTQHHLHTFTYLKVTMASPVTQLVKNLPAMQDTWVQSLGWEDPLEKGKATHSNILAWTVPMGLQSVGHDWETFTLTFTSYKRNSVVPGYNIKRLEAFCRRDEG